MKKLRIGIVGYGAIGTSLAKAIKKDFLSLIRLVKVIIKERPDVVQSFLFWDNVRIFIAGKIAGVNKAF